MNAGQSIFSQLIDFLPVHEFRRCVAHYKGDYKLKSFSCWDQFLCMAFAQLTYRESLRDIEACLRANQTKLYHMGIRGRVSRNTLANANSVRDWRIYADFAHLLIRQARALYRDDDFSLALQQTVYALDSTTIDLCLSLFPWAYFRKHKGAVKLHTLLDLRGNIPTVIIITHGLIHEVNILDQLTFEAGAFYLMDRGYLDFPRLHRLHLASAFFVTRARKRFDLSAPLLRSGRPNHWYYVRSNRHAHQSRPPRWLPGQTAAHSLFRSPAAKTVDLSDEQLYLAAADRRPTLSQSLASGIVLQMDQAASAHQKVLRHFSQRPEDSNLDRHLNLRARGDCQKAIETRKQPLQNSTDLERLALRENPDFRSSFIIRLRNPANYG